MVLRVDAYAKVNLALHILGQRSDGYHLLDSIVTFARYGDTLTIAPSSNEISLELHGPEADNLKADADNLVMRAAKALAGERNNLGARLTLTKRLPVSSGIGGGSADAAAALRGLNEFWALNLPQEKLAAIALELGADVPMCLASTPLRARGIGEDITPLALPSKNMVLVNPRISVSTPAVFSALAIKENPAIADTLSRPLWESIADTTRNDLQNPAIALVPEISQCLETLSAAPGCRFARMSGSGATCFGIFDEDEAANAAKEAIAVKHPQWWVVATQTVS
ncbi:4-(cytidine 5'-diphospho)-2-C-methyl-D-erythritol kinase [Pseudahrensia aquimaris]|uniref:4-diphosphocytidyl-2-C-methyl-D-erythritol kinase n=1 Tax=Pseudahrensia aquimaris TaxID=744461 RepID=A0ABW3FEK0_9HYPH